VIRTKRLETGCEHRAGPRRLPLVATALFMLCSSGLASPPAAAPPRVSAPQPSGGFGALLSAGTLPGLRWPNFTDVQADVTEFYSAGGNAPVWINQGQLTVQARSMIQLFKQAALKGLDPEDYDASRWDARVAAVGSSNPHPSAGDLARFDLALTICAARYFSALHIGRVDPRHFKFGLVVGPTRYDLAQFLRSQVIQAQEVAAAAASVEPQYDGYKRAEAALADYLKLAAEGDGIRISMPQRSVHPNDPFSGMAALVARLYQLGDLPSDQMSLAESTVYRQDVALAVKRFQHRHGLNPDGVLGRETIAELNIPLQARVNQLQYTLERYRWLPPGFPQPPIVVNIPAFRLRTMRRQPAPFLSMRVVVGKAYGHQTPVFADFMRYIVFRPYWKVPMSIQFADLIPKIRRDRNYLAENDFEVTTSNGTVVTDGAVNNDVLNRLRAGALTIRQKPGPKNALGLVKFIFPNHYNVYMHSTPVPELFLKTRRDFSHGCIRVEDPVALAAWVLRDNPQWNLDRIRAAMNGDQTIQVNLAKPVPVLILYTTAVVVPDGEVHFYRDVYGLDSALRKALARGYPYPA
jgi:murein L,D-transpeptidase YcbB/YkuD